MTESEADPLTSHAGIIELWPEPSAPTFGRDIGITPKHAQTMKDRDSIPDLYWDRVVIAAAERGIQGVTLRKLQELSKRKKLAGAA